MKLRLGQMKGTKTQRLSDTCNSQSLNLEKLSEVALLGQLPNTQIHYQTIGPWATLLN